MGTVLIYCISFLINKDISRFNVTVDTGWVKVVIKERKGGIKAEKMRESMEGMGNGRERGKEGLFIQHNKLLKGISQWGQRLS